MALTPSSNLLSTEELKKLSQLFVQRLGVNKVRLTGGEPMIRKDIIEIVESLSNLRAHGLKTIAITTNGLVFYRKARALKDAGMSPVVSAMPHKLASAVQTH